MPAARDVRSFHHRDVRVTVKVDFAGRMPDGTLIITDWKTGWDDDDYESELQMATYVLWAKEYFTMNVDNIGTELVFLKTAQRNPMPSSRSNYATYRK